MGLQHQHYKGELRHTGEHSYRNSRLIVTKSDVVTGFHYFDVPCVYSNKSKEGQIWSNFYTNMSDQSLQFPIDQIEDPQIKLQLISLQDKGSGVLTADKAAHVGL